MATIPPSGFFSRPPQPAPASRLLRPTTPPRPLAGIRSTGSLIVVNALTIVTAIISGTSLSHLFVPYWIQSLVIGYYGRRRILELQRFSTEGVALSEDGDGLSFSIGGLDRGLPANEATKRLAARAFSVIYFGFLVGYLLFMSPILAPMLLDLTLYGWIGLGAAALSFAWNHRLSFERNAAADRRGTPNIGTLIGLPFRRIVPMQLTVCLGAAFNFQGVFPVLIFGVVKTGADVFMHLLEHRVLQTRSAGVTVDSRLIEAASEWYRRAIESGGDADAQFNLAVVLAQGAQTPQDYAEALNWYRLSAGQGHATAQHNLGIMYAQGQGVRQDIAEGLKWLSLAASRLPPGSDRDAAVKSRDLVAQKATPVQIAEAQRRAGDWKPIKPPWWMRR